jgi:hypothetical protein
MYGKWNKPGEMKGSYLDTGPRRLADEQPERRPTLLRRLRTALRRRRRP